MTPAGRKNGGSPMKTFVFAAAVAALLFSVSPVLAQVSPAQQFLAEIGCEKGLIMNGDDLGRSKWSNEGVLKAATEGALTSTSLMTAALGAQEAYEVIRNNPKLDVGVHLTLARDDAPGNLYSPLSPADKVPNLLNEQGFFITDLNTLFAKATLGEMGMELTAQVDAAYANGVDVTHLDCHKGFYHLYDKKSLSVTLKLAEKHDLPIRWTGRPNDPALVRAGIIVPDFTTMVNMKDPYDKKKESLLKVISELKPGVTEVVFHPAVGGWDEAEAEMRTGDLGLALDPDIRAAIENSPGLCLVGWRQLRDFQRARRKTD